MMGKSRKTWGIKTKIGAKRCYLCGSNVGVYRHHIKPQKEDGTSEPRNIAYLCEDCHNLVEENPRLLSKRQHHILNLNQDREEYPYYVVIHQDGSPFLIGICHAWGIEYALRTLTKDEYLSLIL